MKKLFAALLSALCATAASGQIEQKILEHYARTPQEKIYIQTDNDTYLAGDKVWMRAHLVDAATNIPSTSKAFPEHRSRYIYVELHDNQADTLIQRVMLKRDSLGVFASAIDLPPALATGNYTLAAYTQWMMNFPQELFAYKRLRVSALNAASAAPADNMQPADKAKGKTRRRRSDDVQDTAAAYRMRIAALPEGGHLIAGHLQRLAFKVTDGSGTGVDAAVRLVRTDNEEVVAEVRTEHLGMGSIHFTPEKGRHYRLEAYADRLLSCHTGVPEALERGVTMRVLQREGMLHVIPIAEGVDTRHLVVAVYGSGNVLTANIGRDGHVTIDTEGMSDGTVNIAIVDRRTLHVYAERMAFVRRAAVH